MVGVLRGVVGGGAVTFVEVIDGYRVLAFVIGEGIDFIFCGVGNQAGLVEVGERVVIVAGSPMGLAGKTNLLRVHRIQAHDWTEEQAAAEVE